MKGDTTQDQNESQAHTVWPALCAIVAGTGAAIFCGTLWGRTPRASSLLITLGAVAFGAAAGLLLRRSKRARCVSLALAAVLLVALPAAARYLTSDAWMVRAEWPLHHIGLTDFAYPSSFTQRKVADDLLSNGSVEIWTNENTNRYVCYMVYDYDHSMPALEDSLAGAVQGLLAGFGATFIKWDDGAEYTGDSACARFTYTVRQKTCTGIAYGAAEGNHAELLMFFPLRKQYSKAFMNRIESEIQRTTTIAD